MAVPLEQHLPVTRLRELLERSDARLLIAPGPRGESLARALGDPWAQRRISAWPEDGPQVAPPPLGPDAPASILFTSGSTGRPKGVVVTRGHVDAFCGYWAHRTCLGRGAVVAGLSALAFDLSLYDVGATLGSGAALCSFPDGLLAFPDRLAAGIAERGVTHLYTVPSLLLALLDAGLARSPGRLRVLMYAGEATSGRDARRLREALPGVRLFNLFGPTETNVSCAFELLPGFDGDVVPIGAPCDYLEVEIFDGGDRPAREGELVARGTTVTPGYWGEPTRARFCDVEGVRWLRTGDRVRFGDAVGADRSAVQ